MKTLFLLLVGLVLSVSSSQGQMNGYVGIQSPYGGVYYAPKAGTPMYPVPSPAINNFYGRGNGFYGRGYGGYVVPNYGFNSGGYYGGAVTVPVYVIPCGGFYNTGGRVYGGNWNGYRCR